MKKNLVGIFIFIVSCLFFKLHAQDLKNFTRLKSKGEIPQDFLVRTSEKITAELEANTNENLDENFFISSRVAIDQLLLSGQILFNEPLSLYLNKVVDYALREEGDLKNKLRFYVLKSNEVNAYSTDQGIIFFTTGLLAQLENEAQLAFIIAHEASHYILNHAREGYIESQKILTSETTYTQNDHLAVIKQLSQYRKENELAADEKGIEIFLKTDYRVDEVYSTFEMLLYSYLPFDEKKFDTTFFNTEILRIPGTIFPDTIQQISLEVNYNDENHTHPNIETRIYAAQDIVGDNKSKGELKYKISETEFLKIRNLARFEGINLLLAQREYGKVLYNIYLLQKEFPVNRFLDLSTVKALYGLTKYKNAGRYNEITERTSDIEGESYTLHGFLKNISREALNILAYRHAYDMSVIYKNDPSFLRYEKELKYELALNSKIDFNNLKASNYDTYAVGYEEEVNRINNYDSIFKSDNPNLSKYEKIQFKMELDKMKKDLADFQEWNEIYYLFGLADLVANGKFVRELESIKTENKDDELSQNETEVFTEKPEETKFDKVVIVDPYFVFETNTKKKDYKSEEEKSEDIMCLLSKDHYGIELERTILNSSELGEDSISQYNDIGLLFQWMQEVNVHKGINMISSSNDFMQDLEAKYGTEHFVFSGFFGSKFKRKITAAHAIFIFLWPLMPFAIIDLLVVRNRMDILVFSINSTTDQIEYSMYEPDLRVGLAGVLSGEIYDILEALESH